jgi:hypothetical protein
MTKDEALKLAIGKIKSARDCHFAAIDPLLFEAEEILEQALAAPVQEPVAIRDAIVVSLLREGINKHRARELADHFIGLATLPAHQEAQAEETVKERTPQERRDAGEWYCPECFTFGHQHRRGCTAAHGIKEKNT